MTFDGSSIDGFSPCPGSRRAGDARSRHVRAAAVGRSQGARGAHLLRHPPPRRHAVRGRPASGAATPRAGGPRRAASRSTSPPTSSTSTSSRSCPASRRCRSTRAATSTSPPTTSPASCASRRSARSRRIGIPVEYSFHEDAPGQQEIDLRHTDALTMADSDDDVPPRRPRDRRTQRRARDVHAQAARGCPGLGDARAPVAVPRRRQRVLRRRRRVPPVGDGEVVHGRPAPPRRARSPRSPTRPSTATSGSCPDFEAPVHISWARNNRSGLIRVPIPKQRQPARDPDRVPLGRPGVQPVPRVQPDARRRDARASSEGYELPDEADANLFEIGDDVLTKLGHPPAPAVAQRRTGRHGERRRSCKRRSANTSSSGSCATSAASGAATRPRSRRSNEIATSGSL